MDKIITFGDRSFLLSEMISLEYIAEQNEKEQDMFSVEWRSRIRVGLSGGQNLTILVSKDEYLNLLKRWSYGR